MASSGIAKRRAAAKVEASEQYLARRQNLVRAAAAAFKERGLSDTSVDDIAKAAGVDRASLYYYFASKKELFDAVVLDALISNIQMAERIRDSDTPAVEKLSALIRNMMVSYAEHYPHGYVYVQEDPGKMAASSSLNGGLDVLELSRRFDRALIDILRQGAESGEFRKDLSPRVAAFAIIGMANWSHRWFHPDGPIGAEEIGERFAALALEGMLLRDK